MGADDDVNIGGLSLHCQSVDITHVSCTEIIPACMNVREFFVNRIFLRIFTLMNSKLRQRPEVACGNAVNDLNRLALKSY